MENPYSTPESEISNETTIDDNDVQLASRGARLGAAIIDTIILFVLYFPLMFLIGGIASTGEFSFDTAWLENDDLMSMLVFQVFMAVTYLGIYLVLNGYLLSNYGQTIGKKLMGIAIVDYTTNRKLTLGKVFGVRYVPISVVSSIPLIGGLISLINVLMIFGNERRCGHDLIAHTKVIDVRATDLKPAGKA